MNPLRRSKLSYETNINLTELIEQFDQSLADQMAGVSHNRKRKKRSVSKSPRKDATESSGGSFDPIDEEYVPVVHLGGLPWYENADGDNSLELQNAQDLTSVRDLQLSML